jgi:hypothetical protein
MFDMKCSIMKIHVHIYTEYFTLWGIFNELLEEHRFSVSFVVDRCGFVSAVNEYQGQLRIENNKEHTCKICLDQTGTFFSYLLSSINVRTCSTSLHSPFFYTATCAPHPCGSNM